jgi:hypothetical protein
MSAFAAQILPADADSPGANDLGAVQFIDRVLGHPYFVAMTPLIRAGLTDLDVRARAGMSAIDEERSRPHIDCEFVLTSEVVIQTAQ